jgi:uncharacterized protein (DUF4213/DUF364 family)
VDLRQDIVNHLELSLGDSPAPSIRRVFVPPWQADPHRDAEFGLVVLDEGDAGFFYVWLGDTQQQVARNDRLEGLAGRPALEIARWYLDPDPARRALGLGVVNALSQHHIRRSGRRLDTTRDSIAELNAQPGDHFGMVGYFPPLVRRLRAQGIGLTVIEMKPELVTREGNFQVTLDPSALQACNKVLCTGATLLNDTVDQILCHCRSAQRVAMIGPTASCLPEPLFQRGCHVVAGSRVMDLPGLLKRLEAGERWGPTVAKYMLHRSENDRIPATLPSSPGSDRPDPTRIRNGS